MIKNPLSLKRTQAPVPANMCVFKLTNLMFVMFKKLKLSMKSLKIKSLRRTNVLLKLIVFKGNIWTKSGPVVRLCFFPENMILN